MHPPSQTTRASARGALLFASALVLAVLLIAIPTAPACFAQPPTGFQLLGRGVNYGNMLEAPREGDWGATFHDDYPRLVKQAGFDHVRIPVCWSAHLAATEPFAIDADFLARVKHVVDCNLTQGLKVVLNVQHFEQLYADPPGQRQRFLAVWEQLSAQFQNADERIFFELLNEPEGKLVGKTWNGVLADAIATIRRQHPERWIVVGSDQWSSVHRLSHLELPENDLRLIVTVHYYHPHAFTHQGAEWDFLKSPVGKTWDATPAQLQVLERDFSTVARWAKDHNRPIYLGEFGTYYKADMPSRVRWTRQVRKISEDAGFAWAYWELASGFGILDPKQNHWRDELLEALIEPR